MPDPPRFEKLHLNVILTVPAESRRMVVHVPICSVYDDRYHDKTCLVHPGEHKFIKHESYVCYRLCRMAEAQALEKGVRDGFFFDKGIVCAALFERIVDGVYESKFFRSAFTKRFDIQP